MEVHQHGLERVLAQIPTRALFDCARDMIDEAGRRASVHSKLALAAELRRRGLTVTEHAVLVAAAMHLCSNAREWNDE
jgi:hypothetical protein